MPKPQPADLDESQLARIARALAEPRRQRMLEEVGAAGGRCTCSALSQGHDVSAATVSHHLKELEAAGLLQLERDGRYMNLVLQRDVLQAYLERLARI